ncbi:multiubiquitin domain-containing protein [Streptomyces sp. NPDC088801]|uniref:multiubiquitin domain-containing protein n=1 Tax=Streptomyces sp. NPDC088801 TaxID=3365903 RepID=UPI003818B44B
MTAPSNEQEHGKRDKGFEVIINGTMVTLDHDTVTYDELGQLAYPGHDPQAMFTVTYKNAIAPHGGDGILVAGESVKAKKKGTYFHVRLTTRS